jgi:predicted dehydrogenase
MQEFAAAIGEKRAPAVTSAYGAEVVRVLEACVESSRSGRDVMLRF